MNVIARRYIGKADDGVTGDHFMACPACGVRFDMRDMAQMFEHWHDGPEVDPSPETTKPRTRKG
jgi:hypothetical protein